MDDDRWRSRAEAEATLRETTYWHYPVELPWGTMATDKPDHDERHHLRRRHFLDPILERRAGTFAGWRLLDLGCCQGWWSFEAARMGADACLGIDSSARFIDEARALRTVYDARHCAFRTAHLEDVPWWEGLEPFDLTLFLGLFYHLADPLLVLRRAMALTRSTIIVDTEVAPGEASALFVRPRDPAEPTTVASGLSTGIRIVPTVPALLDLLRDGGFTDLQVLPVPDYMPYDYVHGLRASIVARR